MDLFVSAKWLWDHLDEVVVIDASFYLPTMGKDADVEFLKAHIPGALRWNIDEISSDKPEHANLPHMMPTPERIAKAAGARGISNETRVVVYDQLGVFSSPRVWFTLKSIGHRQVSVLQGGLPAWRDAGFQTKAGQAEADSSETYELAENSYVSATCDLDFVKANLDRKSHQVLDARPAGRFSGEAPEPRQGLESGHIPGSLSVPFQHVLKNGTLLDNERLRKIFADAGVDLDAPMVTTCGSGVSAAILSMALFQLGKESLLFDGSWSQWAEPALDLPIATGFDGSSAAYREI